MEFEKGDYLINIEKLKAQFFDELMKLSPDGQVSCGFENVFMGQIETIKAIMAYGQEIGD